MKSLKDIQKIVSQFNVKPGSEMRSKVLNEALDLQENQRQQSTSDTKLNTWRIIMKSRMAKFTTAAVVILIALFSITFLDKAVTPAWANTLEQIYKATSVTYTKTFEGDKANPYYFNEMINENGVIRSEIGGTIIIFAFGEGKHLQLTPSKKKATLTYHVGQKRAVKPYNQLDWLTSIKDRAGQFIGTENVEGILANKFYWEQGQYNYTTVWVNPSTDLPLKVERVSIPNPDPNIVTPHFELNLSDFGGSDFAYSMGGSWGAKGVQKNMVEIMKNFSWNEQLDPALFSLEPPEDYALREEQHDATEMGENGLIQALAFWTEMSGGIFPQKINDLIDPNQINPMLIKKFDRDGDPRNEIHEAMQQAGIISKGLFFAQGKKADQNWHYAGKEVYLGDSDTMVCWWKTEDSNDYRVIYGDLSIGTVPAEEIKY